MLQNYIDIIILDKNKSIYLYNIGDNLKILQFLKLKDYDTYEILLYEKSIVSDDYINIYFQASLSVSRFTLNATRGILAPTAVTPAVGCGFLSP